MNKSTISTTAGAVVLAAGALLPVSTAHATTAPEPGAPATTDPGGGNPGGETPGGGDTGAPDTGAPDTGNPTDNGSPTDGGSPTDSVSPTDNGSPTAPGSPTTPGSPTAPGATTPAPGGGAPANPKATTVTVTEKEYSLKLSQTTFKAGPYIFIAKNAGTMQHALAISGPGITNAKVTPGISPGQQAKLNLSLQPGTYKLWCPIDDHRALGMQTKITVPGSGGVVPPGGPAQSPTASPTESPTGSPTESPGSPTESPGSPTESPPESPTGAPTGTPTGSGAPGGY
ncbi:hypothetical protein [Actinomadura montaniterrae]|uniref:Copper-binding protein n=1 Tax=Actinomadura montaniterrae TaxID=1803903 RepID=A0A6L3W167_9ACTN|nr:hypothetical protein [Actinomadura montaniterrae]KAB2379949.1 hypothetical protein F9B16_18800 [Actinomadura montaniterrae]